MIKLQAKHSARAVLLASASLLAVATAPAHAASQAAAVEARKDLGVLDSTTAITATLWLQPHDSARFAAEIEARTTPGSSQYHHWMTPAEVASYAATDADIERLTASLRAAGLRVTGTTGDRAALHVTGAASAIAAAFGTELHQYEQAGQRFYATATEPKFQGPHAELIAGITGLSGTRMAPYLRRPLDFAAGKAAIDTPTAATLPGDKPATGRPVTSIPNSPALYAVANPDAVFTDDCFAANETLTFAKFHLGGAIHGSYTGPEYVATGFTEPAVCGYSAREMAAHYGLPSVYAKGWTGKGQTIVLVDAYGSPTIQSDANFFSTKMGLPQLTSKNFKIVYPDGKSQVDPYSTDWPIEISLDVEWAHAIAPDAKIVLVVAPADDPAEMVYALHYAVSHNLGGVISNSYGYPEAGYGQVVGAAFNQVIQRAAAQGIAVNVSTGDSGDFGLGTPLGAASIPADSPYATGIGGTSLGVPSDNGPVDSAWGLSVTALADYQTVELPPFVDGFQQGGGGGESNLFPIPKWQAKAGLTGIGRQLPDISAAADPQTGAIIITPNYNGTAAVLTVIGGTSLSSPIFSGIWALAEQAAGERLGQAAPIIAKMGSGAVTDILPITATVSNLNATVGQGSTSTYYDPADLLGITAEQPNGFVGVSASFILEETYDFGFGTDSSLMAGIGWDNATGWGVPNGLSFIKAAKKAAQ